MRIIAFLRTMQFSGAGDYRDSASCYTTGGEYRLTGWVGNASMKPANDGGSCTAKIDKQNLQDDGGSYAKKTNKHNTCV